MPQLVENDAVSGSDVVLPEWRECTIVFHRRGGGVLALDGWRYGTLVVHATWDDPEARPFTVAHFWSKLAVARFADAEQAFAAAEHLWSECPRAWAASEVDVRSVPPGVVRYCKENQ
jgi:hypothetical protein